MQGRKGMARVLLARRSDARAIARCLAGGVCAECNTASLHVHFERTVENLQGCYVVLQVMSELTVNCGHDSIGCCSAAQCMPGSPGGSMLQLRA